jgi:hypothetical protein
MTPHRGRARVPLGLVLIALGIAVGVLAYLVGRSDDEAGARSTGAPKGMLVIHATGDVSLDPSYIPGTRSWTSSTETEGARAG